MKRIFSLTLCLALLLLCFSGCAAKEETSQLLVGYGRVDTTPDVSMPLGGYPNPENRWFTNVLDPIYATAIAFTDKDNNTAILMTFDLGDIDNQGIGFAMKDIEDELGVPRTNVFMSGTHTHSAPHNGTFTGYEYLSENLERFSPGENAGGCKAGYGKPSACGDLRHQH